jgi:hypothetical protein
MSSLLEKLNPYAWLAKALGVLAVAAIISWSIHLYNNTLRQQGRDEVQALWDKAKTEQQAAAATGLANDTAAMNQAAANLIAAAKKAAASAQLKQITEIFKDEKVINCPVPSDLVRVLNN